MARCVKSKRCTRLLPTFLSIYVATFLMILPLLCRDWPYSEYFQSWTREQLIDKASSLNVVRHREAKLYLQQLEPSATLRRYETMRHQPVDITVVVVTIRRMNYQQELGYLTQVVTEFDKLVRREVGGLKMALLVCNTHAGPEPHREAVTLSRYFPTTTRFPIGSFRGAILQSFEKEKEDYVYCLREALLSSTRYVMMVEDDAVPRPQALSVLQHILANRVEGHGSRELAYVKLYFPERWQGYELSVHTLLELLAIGCLGSGVFVGVRALCGAGERGGMGPYPLMAAGALYLTLLAVAVGRQHVEQWRHLSPHFYTLQSAPGCCTPCVLYPATSATRIATHLAGVTCSQHTPLDVAIHRFVADRGDRHFLIQPNLVQHIGLLSSIKGISRSPKEFAFL